MIIEYLSKNTTYLIIVVCALVLCAVGSILKSVILKKFKFNKKDKSQKDYKCDNCGAELSAITEICPYCRTNTEFIEERNWFITSIKEVI